MPDVKVRIPHKLLQTIIHRRADMPRIFMAHLARMVARELGCVDFKGDAMDLRPANIDVHMTSYKPAEVYMHGAPVLIEIIGYGYPSRMENIEERLAAISDHATGFLTDAAAYLKSHDKVVSVSYIPIPDGCWV